MHIVYLLLGSNLGDRLTMLHRAATAISQVIGKVDSQSSIYETAPWGVTDQPNYLNQVLQVDTKLSAEQTLETVLQIEERLGRVREEKWGSRLIDIDLLFYDDLVIKSTNLQVPHPLLHLRKFVLVPLTEIAPSFLHPLFKRTTQELLADLKKDNLEVNKYEEATIDDPEIGTRKERDTKS